MRPQPCYDSHAVSAVFRDDDSSVVTLTMINTQTAFHLLLYTYKSMHQHIVETSVTSKTTNNTTHVHTTTSENTIKPVSYTHLTLPTILRV